MEERTQNDELTDAELTRLIEDLCLSKIEEFQLLGYNQVHPAEIWACISESYGTQLPPLHQIVNDILTLKVTKFMNWATKKAFQNAE